MNGVALFTTSKMLIGVCVDSIVHINVPPEALAKITQEEAEAHILGLIMVQRFNLCTGIKKFGDTATASVSKEL